MPRDYTKLIYTKLQVDILANIFVIHNLKQTSTIVPSRQLDNHSLQLILYNKVHGSFSLVDFEQVTKHWGLLYNGLLPFIFQNSYREKILHTLAVSPSSGDPHCLFSLRDIA